jgi:hypothetical protein
MNPPSDDDPRETLNLTVSSLRLVGGILLLIAAVPLGMGAIVWALGGFGPWRIDMYRATLYLSPGLADLAFAHFLAHRQRWAAVAATTITAVIAILAAAVALSLAVTLMDDASWVTALLLILCLVFTLATGVVAYRVPRTLDALDRLEASTRRPAFEPILDVPPAAPPAVPLHEHGRRDLD